MKRILWAIALALTISSPTFSAESYSNGYTTPAGYTWRDGYWWFSDVAYSRSAQWHDGHYAIANGCRSWVPGYYSYTYTAVPTAAVVSPTDPGWRAKLLDIAAQRDRYESAIRQSAFEHAQFKEAVGTLGLTGNFRIQGYGQAAPFSDLYGGHAAAHVGTYGVNGSTLYGYSVNTVADLYGGTDLNALYQQASRLTQNAQQLGGQAATDFADLVGREGQNKARVAEILAKGQAAAAALQASKGEPSAQVQSRSFAFRADTKADGTVDVVPLGADQPRSTLKADVGKLWLQSAQTRCAACHSGNSAQGGFSIEKYASMPLAQKHKVVERLLTPDPDKVMPRSGNGQPAARLPEEEIKLWLQ